MSHDWVKRVLQAMRVSQRMPRVFVLGCFERRVTVYSQQVRALNLVEALLRAGEMRSGSRVAVVGAGAAGLTFAAAATRRGVSVMVLEREDQPLPLFRKKPKRWLHPSVYDWPMAGWNRERAGLPILDWQAGTVEQVLAQLDASWNECRKEARDLLREIYCAEDIAIKPTESGVRLSWNVVQQDFVRPSNEQFALMVLAVGFGREEADVPGYRGYWDPDDLDVHEGFNPISDKPRTWLVSGCGDGALTDLMRLCIRDFRHERMVSEFAGFPGVDVIATRIQQLERVASERSEPDIIDQMYRDKSLCIDKIVALLQSPDRRRVDTEVTLNASDPYFLQANSSALNRFLVAQLIQAGRFRFVQGRLVAVTPEKGKFRVEFDNRKVMSFDRVVLRHGPKAALERFFPDVWSECADLRAVWSRAPHLLDQTRRRYWERGAFGPEVRSEEGADSDEPAASLTPWTRSFPPRFEHPLDPGRHFEGRAQELLFLNTWLNDEAPAHPVLAICAIGGTGKTSLVRRALDGWLSQKLGPDRQMAAGVFVWSFYDNERVDEFARSACEYFGTRTSGQLDPFEVLRGALRSETPHLLVLDGLERVQEAGGELQAIGEISDPRLRTLLALVAGGHLGAARVLVTSRFPLCSLENLSGRGYSELRLDDLNAAASRALLRAWGVNGSEETLDALGEKVHRHALSMTVLGSYIANFCNGDAQAGIDLNLGEVAKEASDADRKAARLVRLIVHYAQRMPDVERELMVRLCMFPRGLEAYLLTYIIDAGGAVAGLLASYDETRLLRMLDRLVSRGLAFRYDPRGRRVYTAHPFLRDAFKDLANVESRAIHEAVRQRFAPSLKQQPGESVTDRLDRFEALIEHTRLAGRIQEAFKLFYREMAAHCRFSDYARGIRIASGFAGAACPEHCSPELSVQERVFLLNEWGFCAQMSGDFQLARRCFANSLRSTPNLKPSPQSTLACNCIVFDTLLGRLPSAIALAEQFGMRESDAAGGSLELYSCFTRALVLNGRVSGLRRRAVRSQHSTCELWCAELQLLLGARKSALSIGMSGLELCKAEGRDDVAARFFTILGSLAVHNDLAAARRYLASARDWVARTGDVEVLVRANMLAAAIALLAKSPSDALAEATEGVVQADACGLGLYAIDLRLAAARANLMLGAATAALPWAKEALRRASHPECSYAWGHADGLHVLGLIYRDLGESRSASQSLRQAARARLELSHPGAAESLAEAARISDLA